MGISRPVVGMVAVGPLVIASRDLTAVWAVVMTRMGWAGWSGRAAQVGRVGVGRPNPGR